MAAPNTKLWTARENDHDEAGGWHLLVGGQVECGYHEAPVLTETKGDGSTLALDLTLEAQEAKPVTNADGKPLKMPPVWKAASYHRQVDANQFKAVAIRWKNEMFETVPVIDDKENHAAMTKQTKAQNLVHGTKSVLKAAGKVAAAAKTGVQKAVKKTARVNKKAAKKTVKKAAKKTAEKAAKKAAKTSTLKGLVKKLTRKVKSLARKKAAPKKKKKGKR
jgi:hypothetical protein